MVTVLPRHDLGDVIHVSLCADKEMWPIAKKNNAAGAWSTKHSNGCGVAMVTLVPSFR